MVTILWDFLIFDQIFLSSQVKRSIRLGIIKNYKIPRKSQNCISAQSSPQNKNLVNSSKRLPKRQYWISTLVPYFISNPKFVSFFLSRIVVCSLYLNPFLASVTILYPLKTQEYQNHRKQKKNWKYSEIQIPLSLHHECVLSTNKHYIV